MRLSAAHGLWVKALHNSCLCDGFKPVGRGSVLAACLLHLSQVHQIQVSVVGLRPWRGAVLRRFFPRGDNRDLRAALFLDTALIAYCLSADFTRPRSCVVVGFLFVLATSIHISNVLTGPFVLVLIASKAGPSTRLRSLTLVGLTILLGMATLVLMMLIGSGRLLWPPDLLAILPRPEHSPPRTLIGTLGRSLYGFSRTVAYLPDFIDLSAGYAAAYVAAGSALTLLVLFLATRGFVKYLPHDRVLIAGLGLLLTPVAAVGTYYYPSDPERWLFLMPAFWLVMGLIWDRYQPEAGACLTPHSSQVVLAGIVVCLGLYNAIFGLLSETKLNRRLTGLQRLTSLSTPEDVVISPAGIKDPILEFYLGSAPRFENLNLTKLVNQCSTEPKCLQANLCSRIRESLERDRRVFAYNLVGEGHVKARGHPWAFFPEPFGPETFLKIIEEFDPKIVVQPSKTSTGTYQLHLKPSVHIQPD